MIIKPALSVQNLSFNYQKISVLKEVSFTLDQGTICFLHGANGSGKSTLLRCLAGWAPIKKGAIELCGQDFDSTNRALKRLVYFVPDTPPFYDDLTAVEHIRFVLGANRLLEQMDRADELLSEFGLCKTQNQYPSSYSRGMREKLALVIALTLRPKLLLLDEPYGPLDGTASLLLSRELLKLASEGCTVLLSLHQQVPELTPNLSILVEDGHVTTEPSSLSFLEMQNCKSKRQQ